MDSDFEESDDESHPQIPLPDKCPNEVVGIESFYSCFASRYNACPAFFSGSLHNACQAALYSSIIDERRPVLVYIHYERSIFSNIFCSSIFCSEIIIDYLIYNYIVWPWDITFDSNRNTLKQIWTDLFASESSEIFSIEKCPMLIGIVRRSTGESGWEFSKEYEFEILLQGDTLTRTQEKFTRESLLRELIVFKEKCADNEQELKFDFMTKTKLCPEVLLKIIEYLTLNDAVKAFSDRILPMLTNYKVRLQLTDTSTLFINMILRKMPLQEIVSLRLQTSMPLMASEFTCWNYFTHITSLSLLNFHHIELARTYKQAFPNLIRLSLSYHDEINFFNALGILECFQKAIKRFEIHCAGLRCTHSIYYSYSFVHTVNTAIEYLLLDLGPFLLTSPDRYSENHASSFLMTTTDIIKKLWNIRHVRLAMSRHNLEHVFDAEQWKSVLMACSQLKRITVEVLGNIDEERERWLQQAIELENLLHEERSNIRFRLAFT